MNIALHSNQFDNRGSTRVTYDYGLALRDILGHNVTFVTSSMNANEGIEKISKEFEVVTYNSKVEVLPALTVKNDISKVVDDKKIDFLYMFKSGTIDHITPDNCKTGIHCVFNCSEPHGSVYAAISENLAKKYNINKFVPHIINKVAPNKDIRAALGIPKDALVIGRHGGSDSFDLAFVHRAVETILKTRNDVYFLFLSTNAFIKHDRAMFFPWITNDVGISNFINACDIMIHARHMGETFGLAVGEFSSHNKPVMTWSGKMPWSGETNLGYDTAHIDHLGDKAILYHDYNSLVNIMKGLDVQYLRSQNWDMFSEKFSANNVINQYKDVFLT